MNRLEKLISIFVAPMQRLENTLVTLLTGRTVDAAIGAQLDVLGRIVGQTRDGFSDTDYRRYIRARIATNRATGKTEELINIARLIVNDPIAKIFIQTQPPATVFVRIDVVVETAAVEAALVSFLGVAAGAGVRVIVQTRPVVPTLTFKFSGGTAGPGFGDTVSPGAGGKLSDVRSS